MKGNVPASVMIGAQILAKRAVGDTPEQRFRSIIKRSVLSDGVFMCSNEDEEFRAAVGGLILSYPDGSEEQERIQAEMRGLNQVSMMLQAAELGMAVSPEFEAIEKPIGLIGIWRDRNKPTTPEEP